MGGNDIEEEGKWVWTDGSPGTSLFFQYGFKKISIGLEPVISRTEKSCIALYYKQNFQQ